MFWIITAAMAALVAGAILLPFRRGGRLTAEPPAAYDLRVYRDQLREVDRDLARRVLTPDQAERLRVEIGRKVLEADRALAAQTTPGGTAPRGFAAAALLVVLLGGAAAIYWQLGSPRLPDTPLAGRIAASEDIYKGRPSQAEAEAKAPPLNLPAPDTDYAKLVDQLRAAVAQRPDDPQGLALLAQHEARLGNLAAAKDAQARLIAVLGDRAQAVDHARLAALMVEAAGGLVTPEAEAELDRALKIDPANGQALYMKGLMFAQNDRPDLTFPIWRGLLERGPESAPWVTPIRQLMPDLAWLAGHPDYQPPEPQGADALPGPDAAAMAAAQDMTPEQRQQMIAGMVEQLEARLANEGGTPEEWGRLITSLVRIGNESHAREIWAEAQTRFAPRPEALEIVAKAAESVGLTAEAAGMAEGDEAMQGAHPAPAADTATMQGGAVPSAPAPAAQGDKAAQKGSYSAAAPTPESAP